MDSDGFAVRSAEVVEYQGHLISIANDVDGFLDQCSSAGEGATVAPVSDCPDLLTSLYVALTMGAARQPEGSPLPDSAFGLVLRCRRCSAELSLDVPAELWRAIGLEKDWEADVACYRCGSANAFYVYVSERPLTTDDRLALVAYWQFLARKRIDARTDRLPPRCATCGGPLTPKDVYLIAGKYGCVDCATRIAATGESAYAPDKARPEPGETWRARAYQRLLTGPIRSEPKRPPAAIIPGSGTLEPETPEPEAPRPVTPWTGTPVTESPASPTAEAPAAGPKPLLKPRAWLAAGAAVVVVLGVILIVRFTGGPMSTVQTDPGVANASTTAQAAQVGATSVPRPTGSVAPTAPPNFPKAGHWEGSDPSVSFDVSADGRVRNFRLSGQLPTGACAVAFDDVTTNAEGQFDFGSTESAPVRVVGTLVDPTTFVGTHRIRVCPGQSTVVINPTDRSWHATWRGQAGGAQASAPPPTADPKAPTRTLPGPTIEPAATTAPPPPTQARQPVATVPASAATVAPTGARAPSTATTSGANPQVLVGHAAEIYSVVFLPGGRSLASAGADRTVRYWDLATGRETSSLPSQTGAITRFAVSPDGKRIASVGADRTVGLWDVGSSIASATPIGPLAGHTDAIWGLAFAPDSRLMATGSLDRTVRIWDAGKGTQQLAIANPAAVRGVAFSRDGKLLASACADQTIRLWNVGDGQPAGTLVGHAAAVMAVAFSPNGKSLASGSEDYTIKIWDLTTLKETRTLKGHTGPVLDVAFSPVGNLLASAGNDRTARLWNPGLDNEMTALADSEGWVGAVAFSSDGEQLATGGQDRLVRIYTLSRLPTPTPRSR